MELTPYLVGLNRDLAAAAAPGGPEIARAAELLAGSLDSATRLLLLEVLSDAAAEITTKLDHVTVDVQLRGREAQFVVTETPTTPPPAVTTEAHEAESGDLVRMTLRLPEPLKEGVEQLAAAAGLSVNAWLVRAIGRAISGDAGETRGRSGRLPKRVTGFAQA
jgi:hypothetical protein